MARKLLLELQDARAENFRLLEELRAARLDADEASTWRLELEAQLHEEQQRYLELQTRTHQVGEQLRQALATHAADSEAWRSELERVHAIAERDSAAWRSELERVRAAAERDSAVWQTEAARLRAAAEAEADAMRAELGTQLEASARQLDAVIRMSDSREAARKPRAVLRAFAEMLLRPLSPRGPRPDAAAARLGASGDGHADSRVD